MTSKFALVIANTEYQDASFAKLTAPGKDAEEFAQVLRDAEFSAFDDVQVLINEAEGKTRRAIARFFAARKQTDLLLLYFSGHGVRNEQGQLFLAANDTEISILEATGIPAEFITRAMNNSRSQRQLLILDCCNSGAFAQGSKSASGVGKSMGIASAFEGDGYGRVVLTATDATQFAWEGDKVMGDTQKSVFTHFLIEGLKGEADRDSDGRIHVDELYDYAYEQVVRRTPKQTPGKWSYKQQGDIVLRENLKPRDVKPAPLPPDLLELLSHPNSGVRKVGVQDLIGLLEGKHLGLSRAAQEKLREIAENDDSLSLRKNASDTLIAHGLLIESPAPVEIPKEAPKEKKKIEKPAPIFPLPVGESREREKPPRTLLEEKKVAPKFNFRLIGGITGGLLLLSLCIWAGGVFLNKALANGFGSLGSANSSIPTTTNISSPDQTPQPTITNTLSSPETSILPTSTPNGSFFIVDVNANCRSGPGVVYDYVTSFLAGQYLTLVGHNSDNTWWYILSNSINCWISASIGHTTGVLGSLPLINAPTTPTSISSLPTSSLGIGSTLISDKDGMTLLYVPAGEFTMGSDNGDADEKPAHKVTLDAFWIDQTEMTNKMYSLCVEAGVCKPPTKKVSEAHLRYYGNAEYDNYPVIFVDWNMAKTYCEWVDRRLPTEAEWEKAARGTDGRTYPWGNDAPANNLLNYGYAVGDTTEVGKYPNGASIYGALDMAGNVWEWVSSLYKSYPYDAMDGRESLPSSISRMVRGGAWFYILDSGSVRSASRVRYAPTEIADYVGFRCAMSAAP